MSASTTTSIRLSKQLRRELARKARKQSLAAGKRTPADAAWGEHGGDIDGWKA